MSYFLPKSLGLLEKISRDRRGYLRAFPELKNSKAIIPKEELPPPIMQSTGRIKERRILSKNLKC